MKKTIDTTVVTQKPQINPAPMKTRLRIILAAAFATIAIAALTACSGAPVNVKIPATETVKPTPKPIVKLADFNAELVGMGTHGGMVCIDNQIDYSDLADLELEANIYKGGSLIEGSVPLEEVDSRMCFELMDALYIEGVGKDFLPIISDELISIEINASSEEKRLQNSKQELELGPYIQYAFLDWIFPTEDLACVGRFGDSYYAYFHKAYDFGPMPNEEYERLTAFPVLVPGRSIPILYNSRGRSSKTGELVTAPEIVLYLVDTGYLVRLVHLSQDGFNSDGSGQHLYYILGQEYETGAKIAQIGQKDEASNAPHVHMEIIRPIRAINLINPVEDMEATFYIIKDSKEQGNIIDYLKAGFFLDQELVDKINSAKGYSAGCMDVPW